MSEHDPGVTDLLRRASDGLAPDVDRLVHGGITRGRTRQRRARIGTAVASLAVIGVVGGLAAVVPQGGSRTAPDQGVATDPAPTATATAEPTESPTPVPTSTPDPPPTIPVTLAVPAAEVPSTVERILALQGRISEPTVHRDELQDTFVQFLVDGMITDVGMKPGLQGTRTRCDNDAKRLGGTCEPVANGGWLVTWGPTLADGVTCVGADLQRYGFDVWATSCNAASGKDSPVLAPDPPLALDQLRTVVSTHGWFR